MDNSKCTAYLLWVFRGQAGAGQGKQHVAQARQIGLLCESRGRGGWALEGRNSDALARSEL